VKKNPISEVVYHYSPLHLALEIMQTNRFMLSVAFGTGADRDINKGNLYYFSFARSPDSSYEKHAVFKLNGRKFNQRFKGEAVDYWGKEWGKAELEDRLFANQPFIEDAASYIEEIHLLMPLVWYGTVPTVHQVTLDSAKELQTSAAGRGIPFFVYTEESAYQRLTKSKATRNLDKFEREYSKEYYIPKSDYVSRTGESSYLRAYADVLDFVLLGKGTKEDLSKSAKERLSTISQYDDTHRSLAADIHNHKADPHNRNVIDHIGQIMRKTGLNSPKELLDKVRAIEFEKYKIEEARFRREFEARKNPMNTKYKVTGARGAVYECDTIEEAKRVAGKTGLIEPMFNTEGLTKVRHEPGFSYWKGEGGERAVQELEEKYGDDLFVDTYEDASYDRIGVRGEDILLIVNPSKGGLEELFPNPSKADINKIIERRGFRYGGEQETEIKSVNVGKTRIFWSDRIRDPYYYEYWTNKGNEARKELKDKFGKSLRVVVQQQDKMVAVWVWLIKPQYRNNVRVGGVFEPHLILSEKNPTRVLQDTWQAGPLTFSHSGKGSIYGWKYYGAVVIMTPEKFIELAHPLHGDFRPGSMEYMEENKDKEVFGMPMLTVGFQEMLGSYIPIIKGHEGRHRMTTICRVNPKQEVPVLIKLQYGNARDLKPGLLRYIRVGAIGEDQTYENSFARYVKGPLFKDDVLKDEGEISLKDFPYLYPDDPRADSFSDFPMTYGAAVIEAEVINKQSKWQRKQKERMEQEARKQAVWDEDSRKAQIRRDKRRAKQTSEQNREEDRRTDELVEMLFGNPASDDWKKTEHGTLYKVEGNYYCTLSEHPTTYIVGLYLTKDPSTPVEFAGAQGLEKAKRKGDYFLRTYNKGFFNNPAPIKNGKLSTQDALRLLNTIPLNTQAEVHEVMVRRVGPQHFVIGDTRYGVAEAANIVANEGCRKNPTEDNSPLKEWEQRDLVRANDWAMECLEEEDLPEIALALERYTNADKRFLINFVNTTARGDY
jgi:hypothetical protein